MYRLAWLIMAIDIGSGLTIKYDEKFEDIVDTNPSFKDTGHYW